MPQLYDTIGGSYGSYRRPDPRIAAAIMRALGELAPIVNVGAGTGSYEPADRPVVAVEPSLAVIRQRQARTIPRRTSLRDAPPVPRCRLCRSAGRPHDPPLA